MEHELTLNDIAACLKKHWWKILAFALLAAVLMGVFTHFFIPKKYSSKVEFYIINNAEADFSQTSILSAAVILANDYIDVIKGDAIMTATCKKLEEQGYSGFTPDLIRARMSSSTSDDSSLFTIHITDTDPQRAYDIACVLSEIAAPMLTDITKTAKLTGSVTITSKELLKIADNIKNDYPELSEQIKETFKDFTDDEFYSTKLGMSVDVDPKPAVQVNLDPKLATSHNSPNLISNCLLAAVIGAIASFAFFVIHSLLNTVVRSEDDVKKNLSKYPLIGTVPSWYLNEKSSESTNYRINK